MVKIGLQIGLLLMHHVVEIGKSCINILLSLLCLRYVSLQRLLAFSRLQFQRAHRTSELIQVPSRGT